LTKANLNDEYVEAKISRFVSGLRREIQDVIVLYEYTSLIKLVHLVVKVESLVSTKYVFKKNIHNDHYSK